MNPKIFNSKYFTWFYQYAILLSIFLLVEYHPLMHIQGFLIFKVFTLIVFPRHFTSFSFMLIIDGIDISFDS